MTEFFSKVFALLFLALVAACSPEEPTPPPREEPVIEVEPTVNIADIDLSNWKVTLPIGNPTEVEPPQILDYSNVEVLKPYMFDDLDEEALVFYTTPGSTTTNTSYSRTELREQMVPGSNRTNWTFAQGGKMTGRLRLSNISTKTNGEEHRTIVMQIHGRLTDAQRDLIGASDNNAPPVVKIYWDEGQIDFRRKILKDTTINDVDILKKDAWKDESHIFDEFVGNEPFDLLIEAKDGYLKVSLNASQEFIFEDIHMKRWGIFENYFKAGNYLQTTDEGSFAEVKYFELDVQH